MLTTRQIFDRVKAHLLTQRKKAIDETGDCVYLADNGLQCAVGCLIAPDEYSKEMEGLPVYELDKINPSFKNFDLGNSEQSTILELLQAIHDSNDVDEWENELNRLENRFFGNAN